MQVPAADADGLDLYEHLPSPGLGIGAWGLAFVLVGALASACSDDESNGSAGPPQRGGTLTFARGGEPASLDPNNGLADNFTLQTELQLFSQLVELRPGSDDLVPGLAKSWSESDDGLSWTFKLRDAKFSNGRPVTAEDVVYSLERVLDPEIDTVFAPTFNTFIKSVSARDRSTVVIRLKRPYNGLPFWLSFNTASIVSKVDLERMGAKKYASNPIGSGPFKLKSWRRGSELTLVRNPHYWRKGLPYLDEVVIKLVPSDNTRVFAGPERPGRHCGRPSVLANGPTRRRTRTRIHR